MEAVVMATMKKVKEEECASQGTEVLSTIVPHTGAFIEMNDEAAFLGYSAIAGLDCQSNGSSFVIEKLWF
ncbi:hypothetical protein JOQ06_025695 [Pogonophryne albipinna]|uniref:Uncharacterized protein n=1 Tax=Pogonophryne albipinna TaxID=1090488 RepID=A0AAD6AW86_9TELE|nr:hypothetical protein JOQ06_025695 [Pogonophryne albipinna]